MGIEGLSCWCRVYHFVYSAWGVCVCACVCVVCVCVLIGQTEHWFTTANSISIPHVMHSALCMVLYTYALTLTRQFVCTCQCIRHYKAYTRQHLFVRVHVSVQGGLFIHSWCWPCSRLEAEARKLGVAVGSFLELAVAVTIATCV